VSGTVMLSGDLWRAVFSRKSNIRTHPTTRSPLLFDPALTEDFKQRTGQISLTGPGRTGPGAETSIV
jgi:hypothetical protein